MKQGAGSRGQGAGGRGRIICSRDLEKWYNLLIFIDCLYRKFT
ncbi:MAG: hypothetical protein ACRAVC_17285 [Trichormus sp.]